MNNDESPDPDQEAMEASFRAFLENEVNWDPVIPADLPTTERWERISSLLLTQLQEAGKTAVQSVATVRRLDREAQLKDALDLFDEYLAEEDYATALSLFNGERARQLIALANRSFQQGEMAEAADIFSFAQLANPLDVEPLIGQLMVEWELRGPERAADLFAAVVELHRDPLLDMFAANCFAEVGQADHARELRQRALDAVTGDGEFVDEYAHLADPLRDALSGRA